jgi:hypothetical protein
MPLYTVRKLVCLVSEIVAERSPLLATRYYAYALVPWDEEFSIAGTCYEA